MSGTSPPSRSASALSCFSDSERPGGYGSEGWRKPSRRGCGRRRRASLIRELPALRRSRRGMRINGSLVVLASALFLAACGAGDPPRSSADEPPPTVAVPDPNQVYEANTTVLDDRTHGPTLCLSGILESLPPQCGNVPIANWDWQAVSGEERLSGTTWGT